MDQAVLTASLARINILLSTPFWKSTEFWISTLVGLAGLAFSIAAFNEARQAKAAATEAGRTVKIQTVAIELSEVAQKIDAIEPSINFSEARNLLAEISRKLRRVTSPFADDESLSGAISALREALDVAQQSLKSVRPSPSSLQTHADEDLTFVVYYGIENDFANINNLVADLIGLLEKGAMGLGESNGHN